MLDLRAAIQRHAAAGRTALVMAESGERFGYDALARLIDAYAVGAQALPTGMPVGILAPRGIEAIAAFFGLMAAGACPCFMEPRLAPELIAERMAAVGMELLLAEGEGLVVAGARPLTSLKRPGGGFRPPPIAANDRAMMLFSSGSTGRPKGILLSHANLASNAGGIIAMTGITPADRLLHVMPLHHTNGVNNQLIAPFLAGATVVLAERFNAERVPEQLAAHGVTYLTGVPTMFSRLLPHVGGRARFPALRFLRCGSAPITEMLHHEVEGVFGVELLVSYGLSEATCTATMNPPGARRIGSVGKVLAGQSVKLFRPGGLIEVADDEEGEICIGGPSLMLGYVGAEGDAPIEHGWLRSGDLGSFDADGYLAVTGRIKDLIIRGGANISPAVIEAALSSHAAVKACCVVSQPDADLGEVPVAFVVAHPNLTVTAEMLLAHMARLPRAYAPAAFHFLDSLPEIGIGKIDRKALRRRLGQSPA